MTRRISRVLGSGIEVAGGSVLPKLFLTAARSCRFVVEPKFAFT